MRASLSVTEWRVLQAICDDLSRTDGVAWAGITEAEVALRWIAFAGAAEHAPLEPDADQVLRQIEGESPPATAILVLEPARPGRAYLSGLLAPSGLVIVVVPGFDDPSNAEHARHALCTALRRLRDSLPAGLPPPPLGAPPAPSTPPPTPLHAWDWLPPPGSHRPS